MSIKDINIYCEASLRRSLFDHKEVMTAFNWGSTLEDASFWSKIHAEGHTWESKDIIQEWINELDGNKVDYFDYEKFKDVPSHKFLEAYDDHDKLLHAFSWKNTPQGFEYWRDIHKKGHTAASKELLRKILSQNGVDATMKPSTIDPSDQVAYVMEVKKKTFLKFLFG